MLSLSLSCSFFSLSVNWDVSSGRPSRVPLAVLTFLAAAAASSSKARARAWNPSRLVSQLDNARWAEATESRAFSR
ncbi:hypothetical protein SVIOM342S_01624 [Streptomyces violaceorubidus]